MKGKVVAVGALNQVNEKLATQTFAIEWQKEVNGRTFDRKIAFEQKRTEKYDSIKKWDGVKVGDIVEVEFNEPESREYNSRWYTQVEAWSVKKVGGGASDEDDLDLPF